MQNPTAASEPPATTEPEKPSPILRTWHDNTGGFTVEAQFGGYGAGRVTLRKPNGEVLEVPLDRLSDEDQKWIRSRAR
jgi:hypothetical protein